MKLKNLLILPVILVLGACSTTYTPKTDQSSSYDFSSVRTFNVMGDSTPRHSAVSDINRERIDTAVVNTLTEHGKQIGDETSADVLVSYFVVTKDKMRVNTVNSAYNGRYRMAGYSGIAHVSTHNYVEGTLVIDVIDNDSKKSVWRSILTTPIKNYKTPAEREQVIDNAIKAAFESFPSDQ